MAASEAPKPYLAACAVYRYDAPYLAEWVEFHRLVGVERFFLYNNEAQDEHREVLAPYVEEGIVTVHDWPVFPPQTPAYHDCIQRYGEDSRWIAFLDTDEFLFSPTGTKVSEILVDYESFPGVVVNRAFFGTSGHRKKPPGLVVESYLRRLTLESLSKAGKTIVQPGRTRAARNPHAFEYVDGQAVDEHKRPTDDWFTEDLSYSILRINHYWTRSEEEAGVKFSRLRPDTGEPYPPDRPIEMLRRQDRRFGVPDETILQYVPALEDALKRTAKLRAARTGAG